MKEEVKLHIYKPDLSTELELPYADAGIKAGFPSPAQDYITESIFAIPKQLFMLRLQVTR